MKREELIKSKGYWVAQFQIQLFETLKEYLRENNLSQSDFADEMGVNKSYVTQILNGDFDHKISKYVELMLACKKVPVLKMVDINEFVGDDRVKTAGNFQTDYQMPLIDTNTLLEKSRKTLVDKKPKRNIAHTHNK